MKKFEESDIFVNKIKTHPKIRLFGYAGSIYVDNTSDISVKLNDFAIPEIDSIITEQANFFLITEDGKHIIVE